MCCVCLYCLPCGAAGLSCTAMHRQPAWCMMALLQGMWLQGVLQELGASSSKQNLLCQWGHAAQIGCQCIPAADACLQFASNLALVACCGGLLACTCHLLSVLWRECGAAVSFATGDQRVASFCPPGREQHQILKVLLFGIRVPEGFCPVRICCISICFGSG